MILEEIKNSLNCSLSSIIGAGSKGCDFDPENLDFIRLVPKNLVIPPDAQYDRAYIRNLQREGNYIALPRLFDFEWQSEEDQVETANSTGQEVVGRKGLYKLMVKWSSQVNLQKVLSSLESFDTWGVILVDKNGTELYTEPSTGGMRGFTAGRVSADPISWKTGADSNKVSLMIQFTNSAQFNTSLAWNSYDFLDYRPEDIDGINQATLSIPAAPATGATDVVVRAVCKGGNDFAAGLAATDFLVKVNGATQAGVTIAADMTNNTYTLTLPAALNTSDVVTVDLFDSAFPSNVVQVGAAPDDLLFKAFTANTVVV